MTRGSVADEQYGQLWRRLSEVARRVDEGTLSFDATMDVLQAVIEGKLALTAVAGSPAVVYPITIDYGLSLVEMIKVGHYDWVNNSITAENFSIAGAGEGTVDLEVQLVHFKRYIESDEAIKKMDGMGLRSLTLPELLAFGAKFPEVQREFPIIALGTVWQRHDGTRGVPALWGDDRRRYLYLGWFDRRWDDGFRFAAVRK